MSKPMMLLRSLLRLVQEGLRAWLPNLGHLFRLVQEVFSRGRVLKCLPDRLERVSSQRCVQLSDPAYKRPDPLIYSQSYLMQQGLAVTWDNPDIEVRRTGVTVPSHSLEPDTVYDVVARIWNNSTEAPIVGLPVRVSYLSFGAGTQRHTLGETSVNLGVKGGPNHPAFATVKWRTPATAGHYCLQILLDWLDDVNPANNLGQENTNVVTTHSPAEFTFQLRNDTTRGQSYRFDVDTYTPPPPPPCDQPRTESRRPRPARLAPGTILAVPPQHNRRNYDLPPGWTVTLAPAQLVLSPGDETTIRVIVTAPDNFAGRQPINVHAFHREGLAGGVTVYVEQK